MADQIVEIPQLPLFDSLSDDGLIVFAQEGVTGAATGQTLKQYVAAGLMLPAAQVDFTQTGVNASPSTVQNKLRQIISDADFPTLQDALTAAAGKTLIITLDTVTATQLIVPADTEVIGWGGSITTTVATLNGLQVGGDNVTIDGVRIIGPSSTAEPLATDQSSGINSVNHDNIRVLNTVVSGFNNTGILIRDSFNALVTGNRCYGNLWNTPFSFPDTADISIYSGNPCSRTIITNNFCLSNNSQGIYTNALGKDNDLTISNNVCVATDDGIVESSAILRRHGIIASYNQLAGGGRIVVNANVVRNSGSTGVYVATNTNLIRACVVSNNVISKVGMGTTQAPLNGGITIHGEGGKNTLVIGNSIFDFQGNFAASVGAITINTSGVGSGVVVNGNVIDGSSAYGVCLTAAAINATVINNVISGCVYSDIIENGGGTSTSGGHRIEGNTTRRLNDTAPSILIQFGSSTVTTLVRNNKIFCLNKTTATTANSAIQVANTSTAKQVIIDKNYIYSGYLGVVFVQPIVGRVFNLWQIDYNTFEGGETGIALYGASTTSCVPVEGNTFRSVTTPVGGGGGNVAAYIARREGETIILFGIDTAPTAGTWAVGDRSKKLTPAALGVSEYACSVAGAPGTWLTTKYI